MGGSIAPNLESPRNSALIERARQIVPLLAAEAEAVERARVVPDHSVARMKAARLFDVLKPARFGGLERDFTTFMNIIVELGRGCGSSSWVYAALSMHQWLLSLFPAQAQADVWDGGTGHLIVGSYAPAARAEAVEGGYRMSGTWSFMSGIDHAQWAFMSAIMPADEPDGQPQAGFMLVPATDYRIIDNWHTNALCGTGSKDAVLDNVFIPRHRRLTFAEALSGRPPGAALHANPLYHVPFLAIVPASLIGPSIGLLQGACETFLDALGGRTSRGAVAGAGKSIADFNAVQRRFAEAEANLDAARLLLMRDIAELDQRACEGAPTTLEHRLRNRRDHAFSVRLITEGIDALYASIGGRGLQLDNPIQRAWRDIHATAQHISFNWEAVGAMYGQYRFGLPPQGQY
jgi:alkylation response protein AidB-like acyl-CoA dehydrogenase